MGLFFNYDNSVCNEGTTPVVFSFDPSITSLKELLIYELSQMAYYEVKLRELGEKTETLTDKIINYITLAVVNLDFRKDQFLNMIKNLYNEVESVKQEYIGVCKSKEQPPELIIGEKLSFETKKNGIDAVNFGEKQSIMKNTVFTKNKKLLSDIAVMLLSNACLCVTEIENYGINCGDMKYRIPEIMKTVNYDNLPDITLQKKIMDFAKVNNSIMKKLNGVIAEKYGPTIETEVNFSIEKGKCILVSGHYLKNLEMLLEAAKNENINIYTHNDMLSAHTYEFFQKYKNLKGHYQRSLNNLQLDFASFPGAVLITKNSHPHLDVIRGRIFTPDNNPAYGISKISENDFSPIIEAAKQEQGFVKDVPVATMSIGYNEDEFDKKLADLVSNFEKNKYERLFLIGQLNNSPEQVRYFEEFLELLPSNAFVISLSYNANKKNIWHINAYYDFNIAYKIFNRLQKYPAILDKTTVFLTQCGFQTVSHVFNLKILGVKDIYLGECCSSIINPTMVDGLKKLYKVNKISSSPQKDLKKILKNKK